MTASNKLRQIYYSPRGYWCGLAAVKKLTVAAKVSEQVARDWLKRQAISLLNSQKCLYAIFGHFDTFTYLEK